MYPFHGWSSSAAFFVKHPLRKFKPITRIQFSVQTDVLGAVGDLQQCIVTLRLIFPFSSINVEDLHLDLEGQQKPDEIRHRRIFLTRGGSQFGTYICFMLDRAQVLTKYSNAVFCIVYGRLSRWPHLSIITPQLPEVD